MSRVVTVWFTEMKPRSRVIARCERRLCAAAQLDTGGVRPLAWAVRQLT